MALWLRDLREIRRAGDRPVPRGASAAERENHQLVRRLTHPPVGDNENARRRELNRVIRRRGRDVLRDLEEPRGDPPRSCRSWSRSPRSGSRSSR